MKYKVNDYLRNGDGSGYFIRICAAIEPDIYGVFDVLENRQIIWHTEPELKHDGFELAQFDPDQFKDCKAGDMVERGPHHVRILAVAGEAVLLSQLPDESLRKTEKMLQHMQEHGAEIIVDNPEALEHAKQHNRLTYRQKAADGWYDKSMMAIAGWRLVTE